MTDEPLDRNCGCAPIIQCIVEYIDTLIQHWGCGSVSKLYAFVTNTDSHWKLIGPKRKLSSLRVQNPVEELCQQVWYTASRSIQAAIVIAFNSVMANVMSYQMWWNLLGVSALLFDLLCLSSLYLCWRACVASKHLPVWICAPRGAQISFKQNYPCQLARSKKAESRPQCPLEDWQQ